jgi:hypothetical protein
MTAKEKNFDNYAIEFAEWLSENMYENMYEDIDNNGKTWITYLEDGFDIYNTANRYTIKEILEIFKTQKGL